MADALGCTRSLPKQCIARTVRQDSRISGTRRVFGLNVVHDSVCVARVVMRDMVDLGLRVFGRHNTTHVQETTSRKDTLAANLDRPWLRG